MTADVVRDRLAQGLPEDLTSMSVRSNGSKTSSILIPASDGSTS
ncbi:hypothetical protein [Streptomyces sp. NBC_01431]|nr:hypothetical protein [Streptomyces sp. NBC_01431]